MIRLAFVLAMLLGALPARAEELSYVATHGHADFLTRHLYPGATISLAPDWLTENIVALTFDDGPDPANDPELVRILAEHGAVATFFVVGRNAARHPDVVQDIAAHGNEVGNHTFEHLRLSERSPKQQEADLGRTDALLSDIGVRSRWFRPPFGSFNRRTLAVAEAAGLETILWTIDSQDYRNPPPEVVERRVLRALVPGSVVLMHSNHRNTVTALPRILDAAKAMGVRFVTLSDWKAAMERASLAQTVAAQTVAGQAVAGQAVAGQAVAGPAVGATGVVTH